MQTKQISISKEIADRLEDLARYTNRSQEELITSAIESYIENEFAEISLIHESLAQANNGEFATDSEVQNAFSKCGITPKSTEF
ncbi:ribbon-helix-helix protein, CopG family [Maridesulfovibrio sp.]|uniref:CopG family ribbon-helix-helix protein n=1 Tax=Maridesulfovibrio sp. TaxID=2795000 RepID=UPI0029F4B792|nr:ribbon-helix-helix protein, CopG family [Maridesulfovibrio sp.]